jgi:hypothetical protein
MRKIVLTTLLAAVAFAAAPISESFAAVVNRVDTPPKTQPAKNHTNVGPWVVGCIMGSVTSLMVGSAVKANDKKEPRQLTINEAGWHAAACPIFLPWALLVQATCPDNKATKQVARLAFLFLQKHKTGDQSKFTAAYGEACRTGKLSPKTVASLKALI